MHSRAETEAPSDSSEKKHLSRWLLGGAQNEILAGAYHSAPVLGAEVGVLWVVAPEGGLLVESPAEYLGAPA